MKLKFDKNEAKETVVTAGGKSFTSQNYIEMIKQLHAGTKVEVEFGENITEEEQSSINKMVKTINAIDAKVDESDKNNDSDVLTDYAEVEINPKDIPF